MSAVEVVNEPGRSPIVLLCEHARATIPERYHGLGLGPDDLGRHIAYDLGAEPLARGLAERLDAPLFLHCYSRLLIDPNRPSHASDSIPTRSGDTVIPGNQTIATDERAARTREFFTPFHDAVTAHLDGRKREGRPAMVIGVHTFNPTFRGVARPWHVGVLYGAAKEAGRRLIAALNRDPSLVVGENQPYRIHPDEDYTVPVHGDLRGIPALLLEVRNDLLRDRAAVAGWVERIGEARPDLIGEAW